MGRIGATSLRSAEFCFSLCLPKTGSALGPVSAEQLAGARGGVQQRGVG
jgi:hypothetical protein